MHPIPTMNLQRASLALAGCLFAGLAAAQTTVVTFDDGEQGWNGNARVASASAIVI